MKVCAETWQTLRVRWAEGRSEQRCGAVGSILPTQPFCRQDGCLTVCSVLTDTNQMQILPETLPCTHIGPAGRREGAPNSWLRWGRGWLFHHVYVSRFLKHVIQEHRFFHHCTQSFSNVLQARLTAMLPMILSFFQGTT